MSDLEQGDGVTSAEDRLTRAERALKALSRGEVDVLIGPTEPLLVRFKSLVEEKERQGRLLEAVIETAPTLILLTDAGGRIVRFNRACEQTTGYSQDEVVGKTISELFQTPGLENVMAAPSACLSDSKITAPNVSEWLTKLGKKRVIEWRCTAIPSREGEGCYLLATGLDITLRKIAQETAFEARRFAESIIATIREPLLVLDDSLRVKAANRSFYQTFQAQPTETIGRPFFELGERQWETAALRQLLETILPQNTSFDNFEVNHDSPRVGRRVMLLNARRVVRDGDGSALILLAMEDVTDKVRAWESLNNLNHELEGRVRERTAELESANKELEAFCYSVSHDLRTPLRALDGFSDELLRGYSDRLDDRGRHYLRRVRAGTQRMGELIDDLLKLSRLSRGEIKRELVNLTGLAHAVAAELRQREPIRQVSIDIQPELTCDCDPGLIKVVLENLLGNAWKFTGKSPAAAITIGQTEHLGRKAFFVRDNGAGFDMNYASKLFGAFQRLHTQLEFPGNGIGLATVQRVIHRHGGHVWAESPPGKGATFYFTLPIKETP